MAAVMLHYYAGENQIKKLRHELHVDSSKVLALCGYCFRGCRRRMLCAWAQGCRRRAPERCAGAAPCLAASQTHTHTHTHAHTHTHRRRAQVNDRDGNGWTPLHYAAASGKDTLMALQILLEFQADFDLKNRKGETPLHVACAGRHIESASELIKAGCNYEAKNNEGRAPFDLLDAATRGVWERDRWIRSAIDMGEATRTKIAARVKAEQARLAEEARMKEAARLQAAAEAAAAAEVQAAVDGKTGKGATTSANVASKRQKYLQMREQLTVKMKQKKAESQRAVCVCVCVCEREREREREREHRVRC